MDFQLDKAIALLERTPRLCDAWLRDLSEDWTHCNEGPDTWSAFDIVGHFIVGEQTDWIPRMEIMLSDKEDKTFVPFDRFAQERTSQGKTMNELLDEFARLRAQNVARLKELSPGEDQLKMTGTHPDFGTVTLRELLSTWVVHDLNHIAQLARVMANQLGEEAGPWKAYLRIIKES